MKAGTLVSPKEVTVIASVDPRDSAEPTFASSSDDPRPPSTSFVTAEQFSAMNDRWAEQFARFEALLSRGNVFLPPKPQFCMIPHSLLLLPGSPVRWRPWQSRK